MNIINLLIKEEHIAGIEINEKIIRIAYFRPRKNNGKDDTGSHSKELPQQELILIEEPLKSKVLSQGIVLDKESLGKILKDIWIRAKLNNYYAVVSIPPDKIYSRTFPFPKNIIGVHLKEAVDLAINFQLPFKKSDAYIGWEKVGDNLTNNEVLISAVFKNIISDYTFSLDYAGIKVLALESHLASISRSIKLEPDQITLITKTDPEVTTVFLLKDNAIYFSRTIPAVFVKGVSYLKKEIENIKTSFQSDRKTPIVELEIAKATIKDEYLKYPELKKVEGASLSEWYTVIGAVMRGQITKGKDDHISLLAVGTTEAYAYQKTTTFIELIRNMIVGISIFFLTAFIAGYIFIFSLLQSTTKSNLNVAISPISKDVLEKENQLIKINGMAQASGIILSTTPNWSILLDDIRGHVIEGITVTSFSAPSILDPITIVGKAKDRDVLNNFKKSLQESTYLTAVELPINNLEQKGSIPFSISFRVKDPNLLYYK